MLVLFFIPNLVNISIKMVDKVKYLMYDLIIRIIHSLESYRRELNHEGRKENTQKLLPIG